MARIDESTHYIIELDADELYVVQEALTQLISRDQAPNDMISEATKVRAVLSV